MTDHVEGDFPPLMKAACRGQEEDVLALLEAGAHVDAEDCDGMTPLMEAASNGHCEVVR